MSEGLDPSCTLPAYVCGRLMAEFENLQLESVRSEQKKRQNKLDQEVTKAGVNVTVTDRYFSLASTYPSVALPRLLDLAGKHMRKLRRDNAAAAAAIDARLQELHKLLPPSPSGAYPAKLGLDGQGLFALGYYHQKAWSIAQARERKQSNHSENNDDLREN